MAAESEWSSFETDLEKLKEFEEKIEQDKLNIDKDFFGTIKPLLCTFKRTQHTENETEEFISTVDKVLAALKEKDSAIKEISTALTEATNQVMKQCYGIRNSMYRDEPTRENRRSSKKDSGYHSTDSRVLAEADSLDVDPQEEDLRLFTKEGQLVTSPVQDRIEDSDDKNDLGNVGDSAC